ncbi:hypothetical protein Nepgr_016648 [Nepenthes gracilis]|uniref:Protein kinase domain-containing protein n=1 Tax=Nepenthes gracilis TaxID=150966 RepID=A0AAD3SQT6_NEPGR|nr:hypothetical protein Nepgr_016648 [Nepenthes gracilis]
MFNHRQPPASQAHHCHSACHPLRQNESPQNLICLRLPFLLLWFSSPLSAVSPPPPPVDLLLPPSDAVSLLTFKSKADLDNKLLYALHERFDYCEWQGVKCAQGRVVRFSLQGYGLRGTFSPDSLTRLEQLRVLSLRNNSLFGPIPNLSRLVNLKSLLLGRNFFSGSFPPSVLSLDKLRLIDLAFNNLTGPIPVEINRVDRLNCLNLEFNRFNGSLPPLNQSDLSIFNVSGNNFTGPIPNTSTLTQFQASAFSLNPYLCGEIIDKPCDSPSPFFKSSSSNNTSPTTATGSSNSSNSQSVIPSPSPRKHQRTALILGFSFGTLTLVSSLFLCLFATMRNRRMKAGLEKTIAEGETVRSNQLFDPETITVRLDSQSNELTEKCEKKRSTAAEKLTREKSGELVFCVGEEKLYTLEHLMRASAEMLGRGIMGATYKAKLDNRMTLTVKRIDGGKFCAVDGDTFERHMEMVGALRHPNLVPVRAYFQAKGERLIIYDYQPNGSVFNLIHGSRSARAKPLHWTSCLKIAEDVAQGLAYIHQASNFIHGNLKSSNVLLGADFEACVTDYCIATLADTSSDNDPDSVRYRAPELRKSRSQATAKSDVYAFGVLLLEVLSGKPPSLHPFLAPPDMPDWVRAMRGEDFSETDRLGMLVEVASVCSLTSPEQRPSMWHVLKMIQKIKSSLMTENLFDQSTRFP